ncbi:hypothetical protein DMA11_05910 [Marinilabiliaceae bacterium JC017]|nr:hypothetical protein DMA11_05910 [Marinilabiliaceae bacterium JC017]
MGNNACKWPLLFIAALFIITGPIQGRTSVQSVYPPNWWVGMPYADVLVVVKGENIANTTVSTNYTGISIKKADYSQNRNFLLLNLSISKKTQPGNVVLTFRAGARVVDSYSFYLYPAPKSSQQHKGIAASDVIYQIVPDRFSNGNASNDNPRNYMERTDRLNPAGVHGGDFKGILNHLPYFRQLGISCLELTPVTESNQFILSYDRSAPTNHYRPDARLGTINEYTNLVAQCQRQGIKVINSFVFHQVGKRHPWVTQPPLDNWFIPDAGTYMRQTDPAVMSDPYASNEDKAIHALSWKTMDVPRLNQQDPLLRQFLIQNCLWWVAKTGIDGIKIENTASNDLPFLSELTNKLTQVFPRLAIIADVNVSAPALAAYHTKHSPALEDGYLQINHPSDYPLSEPLKTTFSPYTSSTDGLRDLYQILTQDFVYKHPANNIVFADNHKLTRAYTNADKELAQLKLMLTYVLTTRGIPSITYGTEVLLDGHINKGEGFVRKDFPGGWPSDPQNAFSQKGLSAQQREFYHFMKKLLTWRRTSQAIHQGQLIHYAPQNGVYIYFRIMEEQLVMVVFNNNPREKKDLSFSSYASIIGNNRFARDVITGEIYTEMGGIVIFPKTALILEFKQGEF